VIAGKHSSTSYPCAQPSPGPSSAGDLRRRVASAAALGAGEAVTAPGYCRDCKTDASTACPMASMWLGALTDAPARPKVVEEPPAGTTPHFHAATATHLARCSLQGMREVPLALLPQPPQQQHPGGCAAFVRHHRPAREALCSQAWPAALANPPGAQQHLMSTNGNRESPPGRWKLPPGRGSEAMEAAATSVAETHLSLWLSAHSRPWRSRHAAPARPLSSCRCAASTHGLHAW
jgi:hypothetical protein